jgi:hypothetical protein
LGHGAPSLGRFGKRFQAAPGSAPAPSCLAGARIACWSAGPPKRVRSANPHCAAPGFGAPPRPSHAMVGLIVLPIQMTRTERALPSAIGNADP